MIGSGDGLMNCDSANLIIDFRAKMSMEFISSQGFTVFMTKPFLRWLSHLFGETDTCLCPAGQGPALRCRVTTF